ncbi:MAG: DedA family protein [Leptolyngbyaceae cyanobacterium bins.59]|nr:DedA family protein [Leptolyngbyaceae cyanobacterium bins.59]
MSLEFLSAETIEQIADRYGYLSVFVGILLENLGIPIPGETITLAGGFLSGSGQLNYWLVWASAASGAAIGGNFGYWIGRWGGWPLLLKVGQLLRFQEAQLLEMRERVSQNAGKTVFVGRFIALFRILANPLAGIVGMPYPRFMAYNLAGAVVWASVMVSLAFFAGKLVSLEQLVAWVSQFTLVALVLIGAFLVVPIVLETRKAKSSTSDEKVG